MLRARLLATAALAACLPPKPPEPMPLPRVWLGDVLAPPGFAKISDDGVLTLGPTCDGLHPSGFTVTVEYTAPHRTISMPPSHRMDGHRRRP